MMRRVLVVIKIQMRGNTNTQLLTAVASQSAATAVRPEQIASAIDALALKSDDAASQSALVVGAVAEMAAQSAKSSEKFFVALMNLQSTIQAPHNRL
jgi:hypothetical protein